jgi:putative N6-adenine-specific DNA methylase
VTAERLFLSTTPGLEPALEDELRRLGLRPTRAVGGMEVEGPGGLHRRLNLESRVASRVLLRVAEIPSPDARVLQRELGRVDLGPFLPPGAPVAVSAAAHRSPVSQAQAKAAAASLLGGARADDDAPDVLRLQLRLEGERCTVSVDTSGELLYRRGYRQEVSRAPLRETLAAGVLTLADFRGEEPLWDPMCGSGTFLIEGALIALGRAPGAGREFGFQRFPAHDAAAFAREKAALAAGELPRPAHPIRGTDLNAGSLGVARRNARRAGVQPFVSLERDDVRSPRTLPDAPHGLLVANPPYGKRVGEGEDIAPLYAALGALLREKLPGWRAAILVPEPRLEGVIGLSPEDVFDLDNGGIPLRLLLFAPSRHLR